MAAVCLVAGGSRGGFPGSCDEDTAGGGALLPPRVHALQDRGQALVRAHAQVLQDALHQDLSPGAGRSAHLNPAALIPSPFDSAEQRCKFTARPAAVYTPCLLTYQVSAGPICAALDIGSLHRTL